MRTFIHTTGGEVVEGANAAEALNELARTRKQARDPGPTIANRKVCLKVLIAELQHKIDAVPADGSWAQAGDLAHYLETLTDLINPK